MSRFFSFPFLNPTRIAFIAIVLQFSGAPIVLAQRYLTTFGLVSDLRSGSAPQKIVSGDFNGDGVADLAVLGETQIRVLLQAPDSLGFLPGTVSLGLPALDIAPARLNGDALSDLIVITDHPPAVHAYLARRNGRFFPSWEDTLRQPYDRMLVADINGDHNDDLLFYGKRQLGITVYPGNGNGTFRTPRTILADNSFNALAVSSLRDNGLNDLIASNWISSQILVYSAFGRMKFSEPAVLQCPGEPGMLAVASIDSELTKDLVVAMPDARQCITFLADGFGGFRLNQTLTLPDVPAGMAVADINGDGLDDICFLLPGSTTLDVFLNNRAGGLQEEIPFDAGRGPSDVVLFRHQRSPKIDAAVVDTARESIRVFYNAGVSPNPAADQTYGLGAGPTDILVAHITENQWNDIAVANSGSGNLALLVNRGDGTFGGQIPFAASGHPQRLAYIPHGDSVRLFLTSSPESQSIDVVELSLPRFSHSVSPLPTLGPSDILSARIDSVTHSLHIFTLEHEYSSNGASFIEFEQIARSRFIERSFSLAPSSRILAAVMGDFDGDGNMDLAYVAYDARTQKEQVFQARGLAGERFAIPRLAASFAEAEPVPALLWSADLNGDGLADLVLNLAQPANRLELFLGNRDTTVSPLPLAGIPGVAISSADRLKLTDLTGDGKKDIVLDNDLSRSILVLQGKGDGTFLPPRRIMSTEGIGGFELFDLDNDGHPELILTDSLQGVLRIIRMGE